MIRYRDLLGDTICSPITPPGYSGVAVIRVSGENSFSTVLSIIENKDLSPESHRSYLTSIVDGDGNKIDQVLLTFFEKGKSFTGDETVEISCHGNPLLINAITQQCLIKGCRAAERGEFSFRAYYNGKIDLIQAESIQSLVTTKMKKGSETFVSQLQGKLSETFVRLQDQLVTAMAHLEASIDFVEQDIETAELSAVENLVEKASTDVISLLNSYDIGKSLSEDFKILILGNTNAGKSSLFNSFIEKERAIVTDIAGTTRDLISEQVFLGNSSVQFFDSAGLRETEDQVETIGIQKSLDEVSKAHLILYIVDSANPGSLDILSKLPQDRLIIVLNKSDLLESEVQGNQLTEKVLNAAGKNYPNDKLCFVSSKSGEGISTALKKIEEYCFSAQENSDEGVVITQARHFNHLSELKIFLDKARELIQSKESPDIISQELLLGLSEVHQLLGKEYDDEVLDKIFSSFCIGK